MKRINDHASQKNTVFRWVTVSLGILFITCALTIICTEKTDDVTTIIAATAIGLLGIEALVSAARNRLPILARIGPLP